MVTALLHSKQFRSEPLNSEPLHCEPAGELWHRLLLEQQAALINPQQVDAALWEDLPTLAVVPAELSAHAKLMPRLLDLASMKPEARVQLLERVALHQQHSDQPFFAALMCFRHDSTFEQHAQRLSNRMLLTGPESQRALLRFYDPRVFAHLLWILDAKQLNRLLYGVSQWLWRDAAGLWQQTNVTESATASRLHVSQSQWEAIAQISLLNSCLTQLAASRNINVAATETVQRVHQLLTKAQQQLGLSDNADACLFVEQVMTFGDSLHRHPAMQARLDQVRKGQASYLAACQSLDDAQLAGFIDELRHASTTSQQGTLV